jgi:hypothetical protein
VEIHFSKSARKHKIGKERAKFVMKTSQARITWIGEREEWQWVGKDNRGLDLEIIAIREGSNLIVIHVMPRGFRRKMK